ncbi:MAG TPA: hypothetical protein GX691_01370 [Clostridia bacterium]|jgi:hypothetical protein|nr:hypothetical protein [Clostridia bacterium]
MQIHCDIKKDEKKERTYKIEVTIPKSSTPMVPGEAANQDVGDVLNYFENVIMNHDWVEDMGYEEKIEVLRQYCLYWFLKNIVQLDTYPLPEEGAKPQSCADN